MPLSDLAVINGLLIQFEKHPKERELVGKILLAYGELEFLVLDLLRATMDEKEEGSATITAVRTLYRVRSESSRLQIADALVRPKMAEHDMLAPYDEAAAAMHHCKKIRNAYAHCHWISDKGILRFGDLDAAAKGNTEPTRIRFRPITLELLQQQFHYFAFTDHLLIWVADQYRLKTGKPRMIEPHIPKPQRMPRVSLDSREEAHSRQSPPKDRTPRGE